MSHIQIPIHWADTGKTPLPKPPLDQPVLTIGSIRKIILVINTIRRKDPRSRASDGNNPVGDPGLGEKGLL
jgi:hypothetical protein